MNKRDINYLKESEIEFKAFESFINKSDLPQWSKDIAILGMAFELATRRLHIASRGIEK